MSVRAARVVACGDARARRGGSKRDEACLRRPLRPRLGGRGDLPRPHAYARLSVADRREAGARPERGVRPGVAPGPVASGSARVPDPRGKDRGARRRFGGESEMRRAMAVEVRMPTILRKYTSGAKAVEGSGST